MERPFKAWGYPITPLVFIGVGLYVIWYQIHEKTVEFLFGLGTLSVGAVIYFALAGRKSEAKKGQS